MRRLSIIVTLFASAALLASSALAKTPIPTTPEGSGNEPTSGGGLIAGIPFQARYAVALLDVSFDQLELYFFPKPVACSDVLFNTGPFVDVVVDTDGKPVLIGRPAVQNGVAFVQVDFRPAKGSKLYSIQPGTSITFSRVDATKGGVWHGKLSVKRQRFEGQTFSYDGTFAADWCGKD